MRISFDKLHANRKNFIDENKLKDHVFLEGSSPVIVSSPHGVSQVRLGKLKVAEIGSLATALFLKNQTNSHFIAKTKNNNDDANFDEECRYKTHLKEIIKSKNIKFVLDLHGLASHRECDINLGTHLGANIVSNKRAYVALVKLLEDSGFVVSIDQPFMAGACTIAGSIKKEFPEVWTIQIEINCGITNKKENFAKYKKLLSVLTEWCKLAENERF